MKRFQTWWLVAICLSLVVPAAAGAKANEKEYEGITWKEVPKPGTKIQYGQAVVTLDHPIDKVVGVVADYANYEAFMPKFKKSKVLAKRGNRAMIYLEVGIMKNTVTLWGQLKMSEKPKQGETRIIEGELVKGNMDSFDALWKLTPVAGGTKTKVEFRIFVDPDMPLPSSVFTFENLKAAKRTLRALRDRVPVAGGA